MPSTTDKLETLAKSYNGIFTRFSQSEPEIKAIRKDKTDDLTGEQVLHSDKGHKDTEDGLYVGGVCHTLSLMYLVCLTKNATVGNGEKGLIPWIKPMSGGYNKGAINYIVAKTVMYKTQKKGSGIVKFTDEDFLGQYGLKLEGSAFEGNQVALNQRLQDNAKQHKGRFHMIYLRGGGSGHDGGHEVAAYTQKDPFSISFFDCNHGEATFFKQDEFGCWFIEYWKETGNDKKYLKKTTKTFKGA